MATKPGTCPQLSKPTWCTVRDDPGCANALDTCILIRQYAQATATSLLAASALFRISTDAEKYYTALEDWIDRAPVEKGGPLKVEDMPRPQR